MAKFTDQEIAEARSHLPDPNGSEYEYCRVDVTPAAEVTPVRAVLFKKARHRDLFGGWSTWEHVPND
jgi:hypothetical protein